MSGANDAAGDSGVGLVGDFEDVGVDGGGGEHFGEFGGRL